MVHEWIMDKLHYLEKLLDNYEKNAIVFLICDDIHCARRLLSVNGTNNQQSCIFKGIFEWAIENEVKHIYEQFVEALYIIKNFKLLSELGHQVNNGLPVDLCILEFKNNPQEMHYINLVRKTLYLVCEELTCAELKILVNFVNRDFRDMKKIFTEYPVEDMEKNLVFWKHSKYFTDHLDNRCDVNGIIQHLKEMNKEYLAKMLLQVQCHLQQEISMDTLNETDEPSLNLQYKMNSNSMGLCVIINQRNFFQSGGRVCLSEFRNGTNNDRDMLDIAFTSLGYRIKILENLTHKDLKDKMQDIVLHCIDSSDSSFVLCILSHGQKGAIFGTDGIPIPVQDIQSWFFGSACPKLFGKPKIIIVQACRGKTPQYSVEINQYDIEMCEEIRSDGIERPKPLPPTADLLTYWAAPHGFQSFRTRYSGSLFIQCLCRQLMKNETDFFKVITSVNNQVSAMNRCGISTMPEVTHSLRKELIFPNSSEARIRGAVKFYEKRLFQHFLFLLLFRWGAYVRFKGSRVMVNPHLVGLNLDT